MILTKEKRKALVDKIDDAWEAPAWLEMFDGFVMQQVLDFLDEKYGDKVPEKLHDEINALVDALIAEDYEAIIGIGASGINEFIDISFADKDFTGLWLGCNVEMLYKFIKHLAQAKKAA